MALWDGTIGIFEDKGTWLASNDPDDIEMTDYTAEGTDYVSDETNSVILHYEEIEEPDVNIKPIVNRNTMTMGLGKVKLTYAVNGICWRDATSTAIEKFQLIKDFCRRHDKLSNNAAYFVAREPNVAGNGWVYEKNEDNAGNYDRKYLKGKISGFKKKKVSYNKITFTFQFTEAWLP